jgi:hypothetical protein
MAIETIGGFSPAIPAQATVKKLGLPFTFAPTKSAGWG